MGELISVTMLVVVLGFAVVRPRGLPEAVAAVPAALVILLTGALGWDRAWAEIEQEATRRLTMQVVPANRTRVVLPPASAASQPERK